LRLLKLRILGIGVSKFDNLSTTGGFGGDEGDEGDGEDGED
jgi:hypothetical protein